jgi:hypothetical protein
MGRKLLFITWDGYGSKKLWYYSIAMENMRYMTLKDKKNIDFRHLKSK